MKSPIISFKWNDNYKNRLIHNSFINAKVDDKILYKLNNARVYLRKTMSFIGTYCRSLGSMLTPRPAMLPMLVAIGTIRWINPVLSVSMSTIPRPIPAPTMGRVLSRLKSFHKDNRDLRQFSITANAESSIDTYSFYSNKNKYESYHERFLRRFSLAKLMAKHYPPQGGLVG